jgi:tetratricopeptide (TPR) repeat protein
VDIPFIRFAFPLLILYLAWYMLVASPWTDSGEDVVRDPNHLSQDAARELLARSRELVEEGKYEEALTPLHRLHMAYPENHIYLQGLAQAYDHLSKWEQATEMWEQYLEFSPTPIEGCPQIGLDYRQQGKAKDAFKAFERCHEIEENSDTLLFYANASEREGQFEKALELYEKAAALSPNYPDVQVGIARVESRLGRVAAARTRIDKVLSANPKDVEGLLVAGLVYAQSGQRNKALRYLRDAHELAPGYQDIELVMQRIRRESGASD